MQCTAVHCTARLRHCPVGNGHRERKKLCQGSKSQVTERSHRGTELEIEVQRQEGMEGMEEGEEMMEMME